MIVQLYPKFREWSNGGSIYIISDLHFNDSDCKLIDKDWISPDEQIKIINNMILKNDTFICLGDVGEAKWIDKIKSRNKILIMGNHDNKSQVKDYFSEIYDGALFIGERILLSHEPIYGLPFCLNIHGHNHSGDNELQITEDGYHLNLAANICGYTPISLGKIIKNGVLSDIKTIHRLTINKATINKQIKKELIL